MKNTTNVFLKGMTSDMHPLTTSQLEYTDALNATLITFNGNEQMMQNDMGNTKIQDAKTGNIMGLREGFVPVGLKEHGGIMYIASVNKEGEGEIGTIPSPVIRYNKKDEFIIDDQLLLSMDPDKGYGDLVKLTEYPLKAGDKFVVFLPLDNTSSGNVSFNCPDSNNLITTPIIENNTNQGIYRIGLYSQADGQVYDLNDLVDGLEFSFKLKSGNTNLNRWFIDLNNEELDIDSAFVNENSDDLDKKSSFIMYPRISSGYPSIRLEINKLDSFSLLPNRTSTRQTDDSRRYPFTIFDDSDPNDPKYITYIRGFEYITTSGIHPTKLKINLVADSIEEPLIKNKELEFESGIDPIYRTPVNDDTSKFRIAFKSDEDYSYLNNYYYNTHKTGIAVPIGRNSNIWFTLTVDYYYTDNDTDIKLGTYTCRYNPYVYDTLKNFKLVKYVANENYNGEGNIWFLLYYNVKLRYATNIEKTFSKLFVSEGNPNKYPTPSGCGVNLVEITMTEPRGNAGGDDNFKINSAPIIMWGYPTEKGFTDIYGTDSTPNILSDSSNSNYDPDTYNYNKSTYYRCVFKRKDDEAESFFYRSGIRMSHLGLIKTDIKTVEDFAKNTGDNEKYLYVNSIIPDFTSDILLSYNFNNLGFRIAGDDFANTPNPIADWDTNVLINLQCLPLSKNYELERKTGRRESKDENYPEIDSGGSEVICVFAPKTPFISRLSKLEFSKFKDYLENDWPIFILQGSAVTTNPSNYHQEIFWLSKDPNQVEDGYSNNSILTLDVNLSTKLNITGISDYQVIPQINVVYEEDGQVYPGYLNGSTVEEIDVDITKNYFLKNGISEGAYILNVPYRSFDNTSIYGPGFGYYQFKGTDKYNNLNIELTPGNYIINFNIYSESSSKFTGIEIHFKNNPDPITINKDNSCKRFTVPAGPPYIVDYIFVNGSNLTGCNVTSYGLYKATNSYNPTNIYNPTNSYNPTFDPIKLQTVYTYSERGKQCLDKTYNYFGGSAFCGYQKSEGIYTSDNNPYNDIEVRRCLAPQ